MPLIKSGSKKAVSQNIRTEMKAGSLNDSDLAYIAGLFDGEGCVNFTQVRGRPHIRICVVNTNLEILEWLKAVFGGSIWRQSRRENWKQAYCWAITWERAVDFLDSIYPWLRIKRSQAEVAFAWSAIKPGIGSKSSLEHEEAEELLKRELSWLNYRGAGRSELSPVDEEVAKCH